MSQLANIIRLDDEFPDELPKQHEVVRGILVRKARPTFEHGELQFWLADQLHPYARRSGGRWWFASECEIEPFPNERYLPDLAGWDSHRVERPRGARVRIMPQWVCEILSPSTAHRDLGDKLETYHAAHIDHYWLLDPEARTLAVLAWSEGGYRTLLTAGAGERVRAAPFESVELDLDALFGG